MYTMYTFHNSISIGRGYKKIKNIFNIFNIALFLIYFLKKTFIPLSPYTQYFQGIHVYIVYTP